MDNGAGAGTWPALRKGGARGVTSELDLRMAGARLKL